MTIDTTLVKDTDTILKEPGRYNIVIYNDDVTPVEFVIVMLMEIFNHSADSAFDLTNKVHNDGSAIAGTYNHEIAEQKSSEATNLARSNNFPLVNKIEAI